MRRVKATEQSIVRVSNKIISGRGDFSACMLDVLFYILSDIKEDERYYLVRSKDIEGITKRQWQMQDLYQATKELGSRMFEIQVTDDEREILQLWLFASVQYIDQGRAFRVELSERAMPYLVNIKKEFTYLQLKSLLSVQSKWAKRIYNLCCQYRSMGYVPEMEIGELKEYLGLKDPEGKKKEKYQDFNRFKTKVLDVAKKEINENTDIQISYELEKLGRAYYWIKFLINGRAIGQMDIDFKEPIEDQKFYAEILLYGIKEEYAVMIAKAGKPEFYKHKNYAIQKVQKGEMKAENVAAYIVGIYQRLGHIPKKN